MQKEQKITDYRLRKFSPIDRDTPIFEVIYEDKIVLDISKNEDNGSYEVMFYADAANKSITVELLNEIIEKGKELIESDA